MRAPLIFALACLPSLACTGDDADSRRTPLRVFAASSLTEAFEDLAARFERAHPDVDVRLAFAGSQVLRLQIAQGAGADLFASADPRHLSALEEAELVRGVRPFASNELVVVVPANDPDALERFADLPDAERIVLGTPEVPVGRYARRVLGRAAVRFGEGFERRVLARVASEESNVRLVRAKVELGEADAALVYRTDAASSERVRVVPIPEPLNVRARYAIGQVTDGGEGERDDADDAAARFLAFLRGPEGREALSRHGFLPEPAP
ncbi:MAG TPA: molybdate ABC transporter substrate-binding protein [Polyangiaceae bacterium LLY-WYZ-15_(1-7)]|nr:molybdate ABC transporter substrate-binding protein [Polyangiaceae bacterium LLY-WYZ-15_(1-7)]HJL03590.1 molybdate ABC transporter substrate-binding protein [Polyangiaceae bacterium LLY-WYZ-15_(1-7)]HJL07707.1 molybdate ABC transporter substrate-binding protein [Polyangiaceae bacterium LLY-WYZ-15_(1-7)]HJL37615.1 molybdate ABC transporter substrate-binding protein [Polyangiaceae bacterium LLY-WYZ-15_(1-7)]HJL44436.1 molybdate ABC transporter substrate-binding protein [Polyangiaceae bacterium